MLGELVKERRGREKRGRREGKGERKEGRGGEGREEGGRGWGGEGREEGGRGIKIPRPGARFCTRLSNRSNCLHILKTLLLTEDEGKRVWQGSGSIEEEMEL